MRGSEEETGGKRGEGVSEKETAERGKIREYVVELQKQ